MKVTRIHSALAMVFALLVYASAQEYGTACETPYDEVGECIRIPYCPRFADLLKSPISDFTVSIVKKSLCGYWRDYPLVCCPTEATSAPTTASPTTVEYGDRCRTPDKSRGICTTVRECPEFSHLLEEENIPQSTLIILNESYCGSRGKISLICCPSYKTSTSPTPTPTTAKYGEICRAPEGESGTCISAEDCPRFAQALKEEEIPSSTLNLLRKSICGRSDGHSLICCPSHATSTSTTPSPPTTVAYKGFCWTPYAAEGICVKVKDCPHFAGDLKTKPIPESTQIALNESFCGMRRRHRLICCPVDAAPIPSTSPASAIATIEFGQICQTPAGRAGTCISEMDCSHVSDVTEMEPTSRRPSTTPKESLCGMKDNKQLICCPSSKTSMSSTSHPPTEEAKCQTPSGDDGKCIVLKDCSVLSSLVDSKDLSRVTLDLLEKSHCGSHDEDNMYCCPSSTTESDDTHDLRKHKNLYLLDQNICGKSPTSRTLENISGIGKKAELSAFPWMALIAYISRTGEGFKCAGSIINRRYVLTAARCVSNLTSEIRPISVRLGEHNLEFAIDCTDDTCAPAPQNIYIEEIITHPEYHGKPDYLNDIALVRLSRDANFGSSAVQPVCLPIKESQRTEDFNNKTLIVSGWYTSTDELSTVLLQDAVHGISQEECSKAYETETTILPDRHLCVLNGRGDDCLGKGAAPLVSYEEFLDRKAAVQHGIGLFGPENCYRTTQPVVYIRVGHFMKWILDHLKP